MNRARFVTALLVLGVRAPIARVQAETLYGVDFSVSELYEIDTATGAATLVGPVEDESGDPIDASALAFDAAGTLWVLKTATTPELYRVDPSDGSVLEMVPIPGFRPASTSPEWSSTTRAVRCSSPWTATSSSSTPRPADRPCSARHRSCRHSRS